MTPKIARGTIEHAARFRLMALWDMGMRLTTEPAQGYLRFVVAGISNLGEMERLLQQMRTEAQAAGQTLVLMDLMQAVGDLSVAQRFQLGTATAAALGGLDRIAVVQKARENNGFAALVAQNRGARIAVFDTEAAALEWLGLPPS